MNKKLEEIPVDKSGNNSKIRTLDFEEADAYMLARALSLAASTALMCGGRSSIGRLRHYKSKLMEFAPEGSDLFDRDTDLCEMSICSTASPGWSIYRVRENEWSNRFRVVVEVGTRKFKSNGLLESENDFIKMREIVKDTVDLKCEQIEKPDIIGNVWNV